MSNLADELVTAFHGEAKALLDDGKLLAKAAQDRIGQYAAHQARALPILIEKAARGDKKALDRHKRRTRAIRANFQSDQEVRLANRIDDAITTVLTKVSAALLAA